VPSTQTLPLHRLEAHDDYLPSSEGTSTLGTTSGILCYSRSGRSAACPYPEAGRSQKGLSGISNFPGPTRITSDEIRHGLMLDKILPASAPRNYALQDGMLWWTERAKRPRLVIPAMLVQRILHAYHDDLLEAVSGAKYFAKIDLEAGFWQIAINEADRIKTAFTTPVGSFQWRVLPMGLKNSPSHFQRLMSLVLSGLLFRTCLVYLDDIVVYADDYETLMSRLEQVLDRLEQHSLTIQMTKCRWAVQEVDFLGFIISQEGITP